MRAVRTAIIIAALFLTDFVAAQSLSEKSALLSAPVMKDTSTLVEDTSAPSAIFVRESGLVELTANIPVSGLSGEAGDTKDYYIDIETDIGAGANTLVVTLGD